LGILFPEMADKLGNKETVSIEELLFSNVYTQEALVNVLVRKGLITREEIIEEIKRLRTESPEVK
jgi:hypothetical protein